MAKKTGFTSKTAADRIYQQVVFDQKREKRAMRAALNKIENEARLKNLPKSLLKKLRRDLSKPDHNKKDIARKYGIPYSFTVWLWRQPHE